ncbi:MAG: hypothetical protein ORN28_05225 [Rhodoferax sp.]|nr:hypothetical protein [Rhodoferax sp.]
MNVHITQGLKKGLIRLEDDDHIIVYADALMAQPHIVVACKKLDFLSVTKPPAHIHPFTI